MLYTFLRTLFLVTNHAFTKSETLYQKSDAMFSHILTLVTLHCLAGARAPELYCFFATNYDALLLRCRRGVSFYSHKMQNIQRI